MSDKTALGDRMKMFEGVESDRRLMPCLPALCRIDGRAFHSFTQGLNRPYDEGFCNLMIETTECLVEETNACMGYTQSDEISLCWYSEDFKKEIFFGGRIQKMVSQLAALATIHFNWHLQEHLDYTYQEKFATFDARVWNVPNWIEASNTFLWREQDATRNSIQMAAQSMFSHKELMNKNCSELQDMLMEKGTNWNNYPSYFKRGTYVQRKLVRRKFNTTELDRLPPNHDARKNPALMYDRHEYKKLNMPPFGKVLNREQVIFLGADPITLGNPEDTCQNPLPSENPVT